jgi:hypothetical protein
MSAAVIPFEWTPGGKATTTELERGDLLIQGWAIRFDEIDRESEAWDGTSEVLWRSVQRFVADRGPLAHHHDHRTAGIGRVIDAERVPGVGIRVKAIIGYQPPGSPWRHIYDAARRHFLPRFSFGGLFKRRLTEKGPVIEDADLLELSICGQSVGRGTTWELLAEKALTAPEGKALNAHGDVIDLPMDDLALLRTRLEHIETAALLARLDRMNRNLRRAA